MCWVSAQCDGESTTEDPVEVDVHDGGLDFREGDGDGAELFLVLTHHIFTRAALKKSEPWMRRLLAT